MPTPIAAAAKVTTPVAGPSPAEQAIAAAISADGIMKNVDVLAKTPRVSGSTEYLNSANWMVDQLKTAGWNARIEEVKSPWGSGTLKNVIADRPGTAPEAARKLVLAGAHLDSVRRAPGANDNGSGSATLLEIARAFNGQPTANDLRFMWFDGEESGLLGSSAYARAHQDELKRAVGMINMDMVASPNGKVQFSLGTGTPNSVGDAVKGVATRNGLSVDFLPEHHNRSDHASFDKAGVPSIDFGPSVRSVDAEDPNYHSPSDTTDKLNRKVLDGFGDVIGLSVYDFANRAERVPGLPPKGVVPIEGPPK